MLTLRLRAQPHRDFESHAHDTALHAETCGHTESTRGHTESTHLHLHQHCTCFAPAGGSCEYAMRCLSFTVHNPIANSLQPDPHQCRVLVAAMPIVITNGVKVGTFLLTILSSETILSSNHYIL